MRSRFLPRNMNIPWGFFHSRNRIFLKNIPGGYFKKKTLISLFFWQSLPTIPKDARRDSWDSQASKEGPGRSDSAGTRSTVGILGIPKTRCHFQRFHRIPETRSANVSDIVTERKTNFYVKSAVPVQPGIPWSQRCSRRSRMDYGFLRCRTSAEWVHQQHKRFVLLLRMPEILRKPSKADATNAQKARKGMLGSQNWILFFFSIAVLPAQKPPRMPKMLGMLDEPQKGMSERHDGDPPIGHRCEGILSCSKSPRRCPTRPRRC